MQIIKTISTEVDTLTRRVVKFLRFGRKDVQTALQVSPPGVDANPIKDMVAIYSETSEKGQTVVVGYINKNQLAQPGEHRIFSTDADGALKTFIWLKDDGTMQIGGDEKNLTRFQELKSGFDQLRNDFNNLVNAFNAHMHPTAGTGAPSPPTPIPDSIPAQPSTASIDDAKIDEIKTL